VSHLRIGGEITLTVDDGSYQIAARPGRSTHGGRERRTAAKQTIEDEPQALMRQSVR